MTLLPAIQNTLDLWKTLVAKTGERNVIEAKIDSIMASKEKRQGYIVMQEAANDEGGLLGSRLELASIDAELENAKVAKAILDIEIASLKDRLGDADTTGLTKPIKDSIAEASE